MENFGWAFSLLSFLLFSSSHSSIAAAAADEAYSLIQFKKSSIAIDPKGFLQNWVAESNDPCSWMGVQCSQPNGLVQGLNLSSMGLVGQLQIDKLMALPALREINLHGNLFSGNLDYDSSTAPSTCSFEIVDLSSNNFSEKISSPFLTSCTRLSSLNLSSNSIPAGVFPFGSSIRVLDVSKNKISDDGLLNYSLSSCQGLTYLNLSDNMLAGRLRSLPSSCAGLAVLDLSANSINGEIPASFISWPPASLKQLYLSHNNLTGEFAGFNFGGCGNITILDLSYNHLQGSGLPASISSCQQLEQLSFSGNNFMDEIPSFWQNFTNLKHLDLANNDFSGQIPAGLAGACRTLIELNLSGNELTGGLPSGFSACSSLQILDLSNNQLSGNFVEQVVAKLASLQQLRLSFNNISGELPLQALASCKLLEEIDLSANDFTGGMSAEFCKSLPSLQKLHLADNYISGSVPAGLGNCTNLQSIHLSLNNLVGQIPLQVWSLPKLVDIVMWANNLSGEIPGDLCSKNPNLEMLVLNLNALTGTIPESLGSCSKLIWVSLSGNQLSGNIPAQIGNLQNLAILQLGSNYLSGNIPAEFGNCKNLIWLDLNSNSFNGSVPPSLASQAELITAGIISGKQFAYLRSEAKKFCPRSGTLFEFQGIRPARLASFPIVNSCNSTRIYQGTTVYTFQNNGSMIYLDLSYNQLFGEIPSAFGGMKNLLVLNLGHNSLTGQIPDSFGGLKSIGVIDLSNNNLTGPIPASLGSDNFLNDLDVSNNNLSGQIPDAGQLTAFPPSRYANNSGLCGYPLPQCRKSRVSPNPKSGQHRPLSRLSVSGFSFLTGVAFSVLILLSLSRRKKAEELGIRISSGDEIESEEGYGSGNSETDDWRHF